jgi:transcriptional regulator with XRE-family HTH domain
MTIEHEKPSDIFRERLRAARESLRQMSQAALARDSGLPPSSIAHFEAGTRKPSFDSLRKLANALSVTTDFLLGRTDNPEGAAEADPLYRDMQKLNDENRRQAADFMRFLAEKHDREAGKK